MGMVIFQFSQVPVRQSSSKKWRRGDQEPAIGIFEWMGEYEHEEAAYVCFLQVYTWLYEVSTEI